MKEALKIYELKGSRRGMTTDQKRLMHCIKMRLQRRNKNPKKKVTGKYNYSEYNLKCMEVVSEIYNNVRDEHLLLHFTGTFAAAVRDNGLVKENEQDLEEALKAYELNGSRKGMTDDQKRKLQCLKLRLQRHDNNMTKPNLRKKLAEGTKAR